MELKNLTQKYQSLKQYHWTHIIGMSTLVILMSQIFINIVFIPVFHEFPKTYLTYELFIYKHIFFWVLCLGILSQTLDIKIKNKLFLESETINTMWNTLFPISIILGIFALTISLD